MKKYKILAVLFICMAVFMTFPSVINAEEPPAIRKLIAILWEPDVYYEEDNGNIYDNTEKFGLK